MRPAGQDAVRPNGTERMQFGKHDRTFGPLPIRQNEGHVLEMPRSDRSVGQLQVETLLRKNGRTEQADTKDKGLRDRTE